MEDGKYADMKFARLIRLAAGDGVPRRSLGVAVVVGLALNIINQGNVLLSGHAPDWWKATLTFLVPSAVNTYGSISARLQMERGRDI